MTAHNDSTPPSATPPATLSPTILWTPSPERVQTSLLKRFMHHLESCEHGTYSAHGPFANYAALHRWSIENSPLFWDTLWDFCNVIGAKKPPVTYCDPSSTTPAKDTLWFPHAKLNYAENLLTHWQQHADHPALTAYREGQTDNPDIMTWQTLYQHTAQLAQYLHHAASVKGMWWRVICQYSPHRHRHAGDQCTWRDMDIHFPRFRGRQRGRTLRTNRPQSVVLCRWLHL